MYFPTVTVGDGALVRLEMVPLQIRNMRLNRASVADTIWLADLLDREGQRFGTRVRLSSAGSLELVLT